MMGPLSVAQYLPPGGLAFDLVVMDEASQLKPEDSVGAIARGGQIVIVGDPKQLPPTSFFQRVTLDAEESSDDLGPTLVEEGESILDVASTLYQPVRCLRWHYRSRHHSLIAFSNREFYQDDLVVFPSAYHEDARLGVKYHTVVRGVFENRRNAVEAATVVEAVLFTRAKRRVEVFSSLDPDKIRSGEGSAWGLRALKAYLTFARTGTLDVPDEASGQPTNDFERAVGDVLKEAGYDVVPQVGVAGFFIDVAVRHPIYPGRFLLGIECDGASYHSGRSARDRDRLRQEILQNLGWKIYHIWSTD